MSLKRVKIADFAKVVTGGTPSTSQKSYWVNGNIPWLNSGELNQGIVTKTDNYISELGLQNSSASLMPINTVLIALTGATTGVVGFLQFVACANQSVTGILPSKSHVPKFLYYYLKSIREKVLSDSYGGAQKHISQAYVKDIEVPLPDIDIQKQIADILDRADALRKKDQQLLQYYDDLAQSIFFDMFGDPVKNEKGWVQKKLGELTEISSGGTPSRNQNEYFKGLIPWVKTTEVNGNIILNTEENITELGLKNSNCKLFPINSIIVAMYGQGKTRGQVGILGIKATTNQACGVILPNENFNPFYVFNYLKNSYNTLRALGRGGNQENLNLGMLKDFQIMFPPAYIQHEFVVKIQNIEKQKAIVVKQLEQSENLFQKLLQQAFNGGLN